MKVLGYSILGVVAAGLFGGAAASAQADGEARKCKVTIDRSQDAGVFDVTRQTYDDGECICYAYTGPKSQPAETEQRVANLLERKTCSGAKSMALTGPSAVPLLPLLSSGLFIGGAVAALSGDDKPQVPVSP